MKKAIISLTILAALAFSLTGCANARPAESETSAPAPQVTADVQPTPSQTVEPQPTPFETAAPSPVPVRQNGERFETVIILEGMEEKVNYEHIRNDTLGIEMDYDYESFVRYSEPDR